MPANTTIVNKKGVSEVVYFRGGNRFTQEIKSFYLILPNGHLIAKTARDEREITITQPYKIEYQGEEEVRGW